MMKRSSPNERGRLITSASHAVLRLIRKNFFVNQKRSETALKAMILAAGLGTRLLPLTARIPKALVSIDRLTLLEIAIRKVAREGFTDIIVNVHHHAEQVKDFLETHHFQNVNITVSDESEQLLDTGGAIMKASWFLDGNEPFLVHNVDVVSTINLKDLLAEHYKRGGIATLSVIDRQTKRYFLFDHNLQLKGWTDTSSGEIRYADSPEKDLKPLAFSGIHVISPEIFSLMNEKGRFSIIETYLRLAGTESIFGHIQPDQAWFDLGKYEQLDMVTKFLREHPEMIAEL